MDHQGTTLSIAYYTDREVEVCESGYTSLEDFRDPGNTENM